MRDNDAAVKRAERIALARANLQAAYDADPEATQRFHARMAKLAAAKKREQERFELLVLGRDRPPPKVTRFRARRKLRTVKTPVELDPEIESVLAMREASTVPAATPETVAAYDRAHRGSLADLRERGTIDAGQLASAESIRAAAETDVSDMAVRIVKYEPRIDRGSRGASDQLIEGLGEARRAVAYRLWRERAPEPRQAVFDMLIGEPVGYTLVARRYRMDHRKAKNLLIEALDLWPACMDHAVVQVTMPVLTSAHTRLASKSRGTVKKRY